MEPIFGPLRLSPLGAPWLSFLPTVLDGNGFTHICNTEQFELIEGVGKLITVTNSTLGPYLGYIYI